MLRFFHSSPVCVDSSLLPVSPSICLLLSPHSCILFVISPDPLFQHSLSQYLTTSFIHSLMVSLLPLLFLLSLPVPPLLFVSSYQFFIKLAACPCSAFWNRHHDAHIYSVLPLLNTRYHYLCALNSN